MRARPPWPVVLFALATTMSAPARATTVLPLSLADLVERSDVVAHVRVGEVRLMQGDRAPFRVTELVVVEAFQGARAGDVLELWQRGDGNLFVIGDPRLDPGQQGLAFLRRLEGRTYLTALAQSFWWIEDEGGEAQARRDLLGLSIVPLNEPRVTPPDQVGWAELRAMVIEACLGVSP